MESERRLPKTADSNGLSGLVGLVFFSFSTIYLCRRKSIKNKTDRVY
ncbi:LPXTG cell wall anchor domain-containing protein [Listeria rocourtiae]